MNLNSEDLSVCQKSQKLFWYIDVRILPLYRTVYNSSQMRACNGFYSQKNNLLQCLLRPKLLHQVPKNVHGIIGWEQHGRLGSPLMVAIIWPIIDKSNVYKGELGHLACPTNMHSLCLNDTYLLERLHTRRKAFNSRVEIDDDFNHHIFMFTCIHISCWIQL